MKREDLGYLFELAKQRDEARFGFLRHLLLMATGALTLMVSLHTGTGTGSDNLPSWCLRAAWTALALGILLGGVALHREVWIAAALAKQYAAQNKSPGGSSAPVVVTPPRIYGLAEAGSYGCLSLAVVALALYGALSA